MYNVHGIGVVAERTTETDQVNSLYKRICNLSNTNYPVKNAGGDMLVTEDDQI